MYAQDYEIISCLQINILPLVVSLRKKEKRKESLASYTTIEE